MPLAVFRKHTIVIQTLKTRFPGFEEKTQTIFV